MADLDMEELRRRTAEMQWLVRSLAHDFNNLLGAIVGHASLLEGISRHGEEVHESAVVIRKAAERASQMSDQLLNFAGDELGGHFPVDVNETIREVADLLRRTLDPEIQLRLELGADAAVVRGDPGQIHQMLLNLALNASDAMAGGGVLTLASAADGALLGVTVRDTGCGIAHDVCGRIFEPFFTTKKNGRNSGMGLAIVLRVIQSHGGSIEVETVPGEGTAFHLHLPLFRGQAT